MVRSPARREQALRRRSSRPAVLVNDSPRQRALRTLRRWIASGVLPEGERLPSEHALASRLGVSRSTVHLALEALEAEGLLRPLAGRGRAVARATGDRDVMSQTIAILTDVPGETLGRARRVEGWEAFVHVGALGAAHDAGLHALTLEPRRVEAGALSSLLAQRPKGVIALYDVTRSAAGLGLLSALHKGGVPLVVYGDERGTSAYDRVVSDHEAGSYELTRWLVGQGRRRILRYWQLFWPDYNDRPAWLAARDAGHERAMRDSGLETLPPLVTPSLNYGCARREEFEMCARMVAGYLVEAFARYPDVDAIMAASDGLVRPLAAACRILGKRPNVDIAIVGYDDYWQECPERDWENTAPLATVSKQNTRIGRELVELLLARIGGRLSPAPERRVVEPVLKVLGLGEC